MSNEEKLRGNKLDVIGIGNAIVDVLVRTQDSFLEENQLSKEKLEKRSTISLRSLKERLKLAIDEEEYEKAAKIRDTIIKLGS